jgi:hypothetical protein
MLILAISLHFLLLSFAFGKNYDVSFERYCMIASERVSSARVDASPSPRDRYQFAIGHNLESFTEYNGTYDSISEVHVLGGRYACAFPRLLTRRHPDGSTLDDAWVYSIGKRAWTRLNLSFGFEGSCSVAHGTAIYVAGGEFCFNQSWYAPMAWSDIRIT